MKKSSLALVLISSLILVTACAKLDVIPIPSPVTPPSSTSKEPEILYEQKAEEADVKVFSPLPNALVKTPLEITGEAKGTWFFEGSFPVKLVDSKGVILAQGQATAQGEWMTENFVPFTASLKFSNPETEIGLLVISKDNPSGLPENDKSTSIPVKFTANAKTATTEEYMTVKVFMGNSNFDRDMGSCNVTYPVTRVIPKTKSVANAAVTELLKGISMQEEDDGYMTGINAGVKIQKLSITDGTAYIDFNQALQDKIGGSCLTSTIRSQITETLKQFSSIKNVVISINGNSETILQP